MDKLEVRSATDREKQIILRGVKTKTVRQLADETGLPIEEVLAVRQELLDSVDVLTFDQQISVLMADLMRIQQKAEDGYDSATDERSKAPLLSAAISGIKLLMSEIRKTQAENQGAVDTLNQLRQREIIETFKFAFGQFSQWLEDEYGVSKDDSEPKYLDLLQRAALAMDERNTP